jgi:hypothetical protein
LEEHAVSIFRVKVYRVKNWLWVYGRVVRRWSLISMRQGKEMDSNPGQWAWKLGK